MNSKKNIRNKIYLKIGLNDANLSWVNVKPAGYDCIYLTKVKKDFLNNDNNIYLAPKGTLKSKINSFLFLLLELNIAHIFIYKSLISILRLINQSALNELNKIESLSFIYSSLCDYDHSDHLTVLVHPYLKKYNWFKAVKETRLKFRYPEYYSFKIADVIIFNHHFCFNFFSKKYLDNNIFKNKKIITDLDEEVKTKKIIKSVIKKEKFSKETNNIHIAILTGKAFSDLSDKRSGARQYYVEQIQEMLDLGYFVDMFCFKILLDRYGVNQYEKLVNKYPGQFFIKKPLKMNSELNDLSKDILDSYSTLSKYDFGFVHNYEEGSEVSQFDAVNIPHRFHQYQVAGLTPIILKNKNIVLEDIIKKHDCGLVYTNLKSLKTKLNTKFKSYTPSFEDFLDQIIHINEDLNDL